MSRFLPSTAAHRVTVTRRFLTACLYLQAGPFWGAVRETREAWSIVPTTDVPVYEPDEHGIVAGLALSMPAIWPVTPPPSRLRPRSLDGDRFDLPSFAVAMVLPKEWGSCGLAWWTELKRLHDWFIPEEARSFDPIPEQSWAPYFSKCLVYDPPEDRLLEFSDAAPMKVDFAPLPVGKTRDALPDTSGPAMINAPIATIRNGDDVEQAYIEMYEEFMHRMYRELTEVGIDLYAVRDQVTKEDPSFLQRHADRLLKVRKEHFIAVRPETSYDDVRAAYRLLKQELPASRSTTRRTSKNTKSDPLTCIQCAVWYGRGKSHGEIAEHFGWAVQSDRTVNQWSESVRAHVAQGRKILRADAETRLALLLGQD